MEHEKHQLTYKHKIVKEFNEQMKRAVAHAQGRECASQGKVKKIPQQHILNSSGHMAKGIRGRHWIQEKT